jgi:hypothetical protein
MPSDLSSSMKALRPLMVFGDEADVIDSVAYTLRFAERYPQPRVDANRDLVLQST